MDIIAFLNDNNIEYKENISMKEMTTYKVGGNVKIVCYPQSKEELLNLLKFIKGNNIKYIILGKGSNILASSNYYDGVVIKLDKFAKVEINDDVLYVESGYSLSSLSFVLSKNGYSGFAGLAGIPGTIGGAIYMNAGAWGDEISSNLIDVELLDKTLTKKELDFKTRYSKLQSLDKPIILSARFKLIKSDEDLMSRIKENTEKRKNTQPYEFPTCGSVFKNPEGKSAGYLIDQCGLKGYKIGGAKVSEKHANFIINEDNATGEDILNIINYVQAKVYEKFNIKLKLEVRLFNF